jgi:hypothetical protein
MQRWGEVGEIKRFAAPGCIGLHGGPAKKQILGFAKDDRKKSKGKSKRKSKERRAAKA